MTAQQAPWSSPVAVYGWDNEEFWTITCTEADADGFVRPCLGSGFIGLRVPLTVARTPEVAPVLPLSRGVYDDGCQQFLPEWTALRLEIGGAVYRLDAGRHALRQTLDLRCGLVTMTDRWEYAPGMTLTLTIRLLTSRRRSRGGWLSIAVSGATEPVTLRFGIDGTPVAERFAMRFTHAGETLIGEYTTAVQRRPVAQGLAWRADGLTVTGYAADDAAATLTATCPAGDCRLELYQWLASYVDGDDVAGRIRGELAAFAAAAGATLLRENGADWRALWERAVALRVRGAEIDQMLAAHQFHLLCSLGTDPLPLGALGLSNMGWRGSNLWDADLWIFRGALPLWPELVRAIPAFRRATLAQAQAHAAQAGFAGAWYPWMPGDDGRNFSSPHYEQELHVNIWIALAAWDAYLMNRDPAFLRDTAWPVIAGIADFFAARAQRESDGCYHLRNVIGPNEAVTEFGPGGCDDNLLTNYGVRRLMAMAEHAAALLGEAPHAPWGEVGARIFVQQPGPDGVIPEYTGYAGAGIKQADVILALYPLGYPASAEVVRANIDYYRAKIMDYGPLMTHQIESCLLMRIGARDEGLDRLFAGMKLFSRGKHHIPFECIGNSGSIMLTGIGGELQALLFGYFGFTLPEEALSAPSIPFKRQQDSGGGVLP